MFIHALEEHMCSYPPCSTLKHHISIFMHPFPPYFLTFSYPWYGAFGLLRNMVLGSIFSDTMSFGPSYPSTIPFTKSCCFPSIYYALALPCHWSQSILSHVCSIHSFLCILSILYICSYHIQFNSSTTTIKFIYPFSLLPHQIDSTLIILHPINIILPISSMFILPLAFQFHLFIQLPIKTSKTYKKISLCNQSNLAILYINP